MHYDVLVGCEFSGRIREAFRRRGINAVSCDLEPAEDASPHHIQGDVTPLLNRRWKLAIFNPPCTHLANSGARWNKPQETIDEAVAFFMACLNANAPYIAVENPVMNLKRTGIRKPDFTVQPWMFGDNQKKRTCFWTKNLPPLVPTSDLDGTTAGADIHRAPPGPDRWKFRSRTFPGIAEAIASQWGALL